MAAFIRAACVPRDGPHGSGDLERVSTILAAHPEVATASVHTAAILGDDAGVRSLVAHDPEAATRPGGPYGWDALTHLCFSRYLRLDPARSHGFYFGLARGGTALHAAAWRAWPDTVRLLVERHAPVDARDGERRMPLVLAVRACVDSYWTARRSPESVAVLLNAGASVEGVPYPCGYAEVDELLRAHGATSDPRRAAGT